MPSVPVSQCADNLGLTEQSFDRMIMVKSLTPTDGIKSGDA